MKYFLLQFAALLTPGDGEGQVNIPKVEGDALLTNGLNIAYFAAGIIAIVVIIVGAIMYTTSAGEAANITKAKNLILFAVVGLVIIVSAFAVTNFVFGRF